MTTHTPALSKSFQATAVAIAQGVRVKVDSSGLISAAGATDSAIGTTLAAVAASDYGTVLLFGPTLLVTASAAIARGALLYPTASGRVDDAGTTAIDLVSLEAATAAGDIIEAAQSRLGA